MGMSGMETNMRKALAIVALCSAGFLGVAACTAVIPAVRQSPWPTKLLPQPTAAAADKSSMARDIARIAAGKGGLAALAGRDGQATAVICDPSTVSNPSDVGIPRSASCEIRYSDGSIWNQRVTVTFDRHGRPVADSAAVGTEVLSPAGW
jgi:hypothetical protein